MNYCYKRFIKLDEERKYNKFYSTFLSNYNSTSVRFNIFINNQIQELGLQDINLDDLTIPGNSSRRIEEIDQKYDIDTIIGKLA